MSGSVVMAVCLDKRSQEAPKIQEVLTRHGCIINARLGLHEANSTSCSEEGLIILHLKGEPTEIDALKNDLEKIYGVRVKSMEI